MHILTDRMKVPTCGTRKMKTKIQIQAALSVFGRSTRNSLLGALKLQYSLEPELTCDVMKSKVAFEMIAEQSTTTKTKMYITTFDTFSAKSNHFAETVDPVVTSTGVFSNLSHFCCCFSGRLRQKSCGF